MFDFSMKICKWKNIEKSIFRELFKGDVPYLAFLWTEQIYHHCLYMGKYSRENFSRTIEEGCIEFGTGAFNQEIFQYSG